MACVLVADEHLLITEMLRTMLERRGHDVLTANNGIKAKAILRSIVIDIAMIDIMMTVQEGMETMMVLNYEYPDMKIIAMIGGDTTPQNIYLDVARQIGAEFTLNKPFRDVEVLQTINNALNYKTSFTFN